MATKTLDSKNEFQDIKVKDYADQELNALAVLMTTIEKLNADQRHRVFKYLKSKYSKDWPSNDEGY